MHNRRYDCGGFPPALVEYLLACEKFEEARNREKPDLTAVEEARLAKCDAARRWWDTLEKESEEC